MGFKTLQARCLEIAVTRVLPKGWGTMPSFNYKQRVATTSVLVSTMISVIFIENYPIKLNRIEYGLVCLGSYGICLLISFLFFKYKRPFGSKEKD